MATEYVGTITLWPSPKKIPANWLPCDGRTLQAANYYGLISAIGYTFGGSGNSFNLPDLRGKAPIPGTQYIICFNGDFPENDI